MNNYFKQLIERFENNLKLYVGYPPNTLFDYSELYPLLKYPINNLGDAFELKNPFSTHEYEVEVIKWFLRLYGLLDDQGWGYVTSGGTEGVIFGVWNGREKLTNPRLYFTDYAHYSIPKAGKLLGLEECMIKTDEKGEMDYQDFAEKLDPKRDALIVATLGSTITSSIDNIAKIKRILGSQRVNYYIHGDAAIDGMVLPFIKTDIPHTFKDGFDSISLSGHKIIGSPIPCGVVLAKQNYAAVDQFIDYVHNMDTTITGSRNGFAALILWYAIKKNGRVGFNQFIQESLTRANTYLGNLQQQGIHAWRFETSISIILDKLPPILMQKWRAPSNHSYTTLTALPKLSPRMLQEFIDDILAYRKNPALFKPNTKLLYPVTTNEIKLDDI